MVWPGITFSLQRPKSVRIMWPVLSRRMFSGLRSLGLAADKDITSHRHDRARTWEGAYVERVMSSSKHNMPCHVQSNSRAENTPVDNVEGMHVAEGRGNFGGVEQ